MIQADKALRIMQLYERDYDNFFGNLKAKHKKKKEEADKKKKEAGKKVAEAGRAQTDADRAGKTVKEADAHKGFHLAQKAKELIDKNGGVEGVKDTVENVLKYAKTSTPSDYEIGLGKTDEEKVPDKTILGMPPMVVYGGGVILALLGLFGISKLVTKSNNASVATSTLSPAV